MSAGLLEEYSEWNGVSYIHTLEPRLRALLYQTNHETRRLRHQIVCHWRWHRCSHRLAGSRRRIVGRSSLLLRGWRRWRMYYWEQRYIQVSLSILLYSFFASSLLLSSKGGNLLLPCSKGFIAEEPFPLSVCRVVDGLVCVYGV